ncbi:CDP-6-deoxy-delta-3,4-glucoseen reductase [Denitratisoma oestradiolicum]|uniref:CDP-6-deoxy-L-threo-D-glycero-4-hexulose-3-dehydrase reductase n=1 Tax=Denitratisoma oestradiolicum TaxID=311182 RepID=A0A6S6Y4H2_9PROT|nr:CDP-6-deoxy-delta-3,4-glucoseen reductase [Denitratisoma oestradiolicum]TWO79742.1 CDP-6-deoxy-delta-3,4-glucoseen reductase [Denitratisoma oestradiolicum]CAB1367508.1 CDP-6-deoxy-L-threo-D-glycero-4-hexulose-3-dehydrase reductase [Denitratisoma oestradiolicum]
MTYKITLKPSGHSFDAPADEPLLKSADQAGFKLPYGCSAGACGACKAKVVTGQVDYGDYQDHALSVEEKAAGMALMCCATPRSDLTVEVREVGALGSIAVRKLPCRVQKMERVASDVMVLQLKLPASEPLQFLAGQYLEFIRPDGSRRAFSIANAPHQNEFVEIHVRLVPDGEFTAQVFGTMKEKDILRIEAPLGSFFLREDSDRPIILLAGGTGFAPIKSLVEHALHKGIVRPIHLYWGARDKAGLYLDELPRRWATQHPHIHYIPVLSDAPVADAWQGRQGLVHQAVLKDFADLSGHDIYACGAPAMIEAAHSDFLARGLIEESFFADSFTFAAH